MDEQSDLSQEGDLATKSQDIDSQTPKKRQRKEVITASPLVIRSHDPRASRQDRADYSAELAKYGMC